MPWTLYRYILKDLLKLLVISSLVLILVISFAAAIKPLSGGLLGPGTMAKYVLYLAPTMLGFILPFSGAFASTLVFSRMANDNELLVCRAGGISYGMVLLPVVFLGLVLTLTLFFLSNWVVPSFYRSAAYMLEKDIMQVVVSQVHQGRPVMLGDRVLYADAVDDTQLPPVIPNQSVQPTQLIRLRGVAVGQLDDRGRLRSDSTAQKADILLYHVDRQTWATVSLEDVVFYDAMRGDLFYTRQWVLPQLLLPSPIEDDLRFLTWPQIRDLRLQPESYDQIRIRKHQLAQTVAAEALLQKISDSLVGPSSGRSDHGVMFLSPHGDGQYWLTAPALQRQPDSSALGDVKVHLASQGAIPVRVEYRRGGKVVRRVEADRAVLWIEPGDPQPEPWIQLDLESALVMNMGRDEPATEHATVSLPRCRWPAQVLEPVTNLSSGSLLGLADHRYQSVDAVVQAASNFRYLVFQLLRKIEAQLHERAALSVACLLMLLLGAIISMKIGGGMPLVTYFWSFMSAIVVVIISHSGENLAGQLEVSRSIGLSVIWLGNLLLVIGLCTTYLGLARN